jgi:signal peptidase II
MTAYQWRWALPVAGAILFADLITKQVVQVIFAYGERFAVTGFFNLVFVLNPGAAFSFLADAGGWQRPALLGLGAVISVLIAFWLIRNPMNRLTAFGFAAVLGGALGNVIDRARHGAVVDWLDFHLVGWHWPAFNIADIGITAGAAALVLDAMFVAPRKSGQQSAPKWRWGR